MQKREKVPATQKPSPGQIGNVAARFLSRLNGLTASDCDRIANDKATGAKFDRGVAALLVELGMGGVMSSAHAQDIARWETNFEKLFGYKPNLSTLVIPPKPTDLGHLRLIIVAKEIVGWTDNHPLQGTMNALKKHFKCWQYVDNLDESITKNNRDPRSGSYALWVKDVREADEENANKSANDLASENHVGLTILERMLHEADYFLEHGEHPDQQNVTLCTGSRSSEGRVPYAYWDVGEFSVRWYRPARRGPRLRSRRACI